MAHLNTPSRKLYDYPWNLTGSPEMAKSEDLAQVIGALRVDDFHSARAPARRLLEAFPGELDAHVLFAHTLYLSWLGEPTPENRRALERSVGPLERLDPDNPYGSVFRAMLLDEGDNRPQEANELYSRILARGDLSAPLRAWVLRNRAYGFNRAGLSLAAMADAEEALSVDPLHGASYAALSEALLQVGLLEKAALRAKQAVALLPGDDISNYVLGWTQYKLGAVEQSIATLEGPCETHKDQVICALYAASLQRAGRETEALAAAEGASRLTDRRLGNVHLARYWLLAGNRDQALRRLRRCVEPGVPSAYVTQLYFAEDDPDFAPLRGDPEFQAIVAEATKRIENE